MAGRAEAILVGEAIAVFVESIAKVRHEGRGVGRQGVHGGQVGREGVHRGCGESVCGSEVGYREVGHREVGYREVGYREVGHREVGHREVGWKAHVRAWREARFGARQGAHVGHRAIRCQSIRGQGIRGQSVHRSVDEAVSSVVPIRGHRPVRPAQA